jgi:predicted nucleotidyltransferase component of viral defense system
MRSLFLSDNPTLEQLLEVQEHFGLPGPALVEKDWYVVKALATIAAVDAGDFRLVFGGGTALSRAYKLTKRMSEDVDLKIVRDKAPTRGELRKLRNKITDALLGSGFVFDPTNNDHRKTMYEGRYTKYQLPYKALAQGKGILRPDAVDKPVISFIAEAYDRDPELPKIACSSHDPRRVRCERNRQAGP